MGAIGVRGDGVLGAEGESVVGEEGEGDVGVFVDPGETSLDTLDLEADEAVEDILDWLFSNKVSILVIWSRNQMCTYLSKRSLPKEGINSIVHLIHEDS